MSDKSGKGKKFCPECKSVCGAAAKICYGCKHEFTKHKEEKEKHAPRRGIIPDGYSSYKITSTVYVPAGYCPIPFPAKDKISVETIDEWADKVRMHFIKKQNAWLMNNGLRYYLRYEYEEHDESYDKARELIETLPDIKYVEIENDN